MSETYYDKESNECISKTNNTQNQNLIITFLCIIAVLICLIVILSTVFIIKKIKKNS